MKPPPPKSPSRHAFTLPKLRGRLCAFTLPKLRGRPSAFTLPKPRGRFSAFTLVEMLVVIAIILILMVLLAPAFTSLKSAGDTTNAAYTIKGVLEQARTYAMANNTYVWVGFYEEPAIQAPTTPATPGIGRVVISTVASKDGTTVYNPNSLAAIDPTRVTQVGKLTRIEGIHLTTFADGSGTGTTFDSRPPAVYDTARIGDTSPPSPSLTPFQYPVGTPAPTAQYTFTKAVEFSPRGEARIDNRNYSLRPVFEIGFVPTHGTYAPTPTPSPGLYSGNVVAVQFSGFGGNFKLYRR
jgi:prepilin-type N-terminal cleavage/methylation domain-containing protein